jgi:hypothetical protein
MRLVRSRFARGHVAEGLWNLVALVLLCLSMAFILTADSWGCPFAVEIFSVQTGAICAYLRVLA